MSWSWKKILLTVIIALVFVVAAMPSTLIFSQVSANTTNNNPAIDALNKKISEKKDKIKELEDSIERAKKDIEKKQLEGVSLKNQMAILDNHTAQMELDIAATKAKVDALQFEIEALGLSIADKKKLIDGQKQLIAELLRSLHYADGKRPIEILAAYNTFSDFYNQLQYTQTVETQLAQNTDAISLEKTDLESKEKATMDRKKAYETLMDELDGKKKDLGEQLFAKQNLLAQTQSSELTYKALLSNLRRQYQAEEGEISSIEQEVRHRLDEQHKLQEEAVIGTIGGLFAWPTQSRYISAFFHDPDYPFRNIFEHSGVDIRASQGTPVKAAGAGYVARAKRCTSASCYSYVMIIHANGLATVYGHLSQVATTEDKFVTRGDIIGYSGGMPGTVGAGPFVTGPHLHFEVRSNGIPVNPLGYLPPAS